MTLLMIILMSVLKRNMYFFEAFSEKVGINPEKIHNRIQTKFLLLVLEE